MTAVQINVFQIDELLCHILSFVKDGSKDERSALYAVAQVNTHWSHIGLNLLWSDITLQDWFRFIGFTTQTESPSQPDDHGLRHCLSHKHKNSSAMVQRFHERAQRFNEVYAPKVRHMRLDFGKDNAGMGPLLLQSLLSLSSFNLPKLATLDIGISLSAFQTELLKKFLRPGLARCSITMRCGPSILHTVDEQQDAAVAALQAMPCVTHFRLEDRSSDRLYSAQIDVLRDAPALVEVVLAPLELSPGNVIALSQNPSLREIKCPKGATRMWSNEFPDRWGDMLALSLHTPSSLHASPLSNLTHLTVCALVPHATSMLEKGFNPTILTSINILVAALAHPYEVLALTEMVSRRFDRLRQFTLNVPSCEKYMAQLPDLDWTALQPLYACQAMEELEIYWDTAIVVSNKQIEEAASSWPGLRRLLVGSKCISWEEARSSLTLDCLTSLARHCPSLCELFLHLSPVLSDSDEAAFEQSQWCLPESRKVFPFMRAVTFHLGTPLPLGAARPQVAQFLEAALPESCEVLCSYVVAKSRGLRTRRDTNNAAKFWNAQQNNVMEFWASIVAALSDR